VSAAPFQSFQRHIKAPRARVFAALTTAADYQRWNVPDTMTSVVHEFDARPGGKFRVSLTYMNEGAGKSGAHTDTYHGVFTELVPNEKLVQEIQFESANPALQGTMRITFALLDDGRERSAARSSTRATKACRASFAPKTTSSAGRSRSELAALCER